MSEVGVLATVSLNDVTEVFGREMEHIQDASVSVRDCFFFFQAEDGIRDYKVTGVQTCALPIFANEAHADLFVSIHCNAARRRKLAGVETWTLNVASDRYAARLAAFENAEADRKIGRASCRERG